jgi:hypothetical protein
MLCGAMDGGMYPVEANKEIAMQCYVVLCGVR